MRKKDKTVRISYKRPGSIIRFHRLTAVPYDAVDITAQVETSIPLDPPIDDRDVVRVRFAGEHKTYAYYCRGAGEGDLVAVPPNSITPQVQVVRVIGLGRTDESHYRPLRTARLVPQQTLEGMEGVG